MATFYQLSAQGVLHRMEAGHAGAGASNPIPAKLVTLSKYELCDLPGCFGTKHEAEVGGALKAQAVEDAEEAERASPKRRTRRIDHGVQAAE